MLKLHIVICSTRPNRVGPSVARWFHGVAVEKGNFEVRLVDLAEVNLPLFDEPRHPSMQKYEHQHTRDWSAIVEAADAFVFVTPEYNNGPPPSLVNALDFVYKEWNYKPAAFVSYGGVSGGLRAVQAEKLILATLKMPTLTEAVTIPGVSRQVADGVFTPTDRQVEAADGLLDELHRWAEALRPMRRP